MKPTPRDYQVAIVEDTLAYLRSSEGTKPAFFDVTVGGGKTALASFIAENTISKGGRVLGVARIGELVLQNGMFATDFGLPVSYFSASVGAKRLKHNLVWGTEGTIARALDKEFANWVPDLLIIDECHQLDYEKDDSQLLRIYSHFKRLNPRLRCLGMTGSPFRGTEYIEGEFWKKCIGRITTEQLIHDGWLVEPHFGWPEHEEDSFDFSELEQAYGGFEFTDEQYDEFRKGDPTLTKRIMAEVVHRTADCDMGVLIFAQSKKHCQEVADALPSGSWAIITDDTPEALRAQSLKKAQSGEIKFTINCSVLTTGVNVPRWRTVVYLRRVSSLVLLIQSMGRVLRLFIESGVDMNALTAEQRKEEIAASQKPFARVLDFAGVMDRLGSLYENPLLAEAEYEKAKREGSTIVCPQCNTENSEKARRCRGVDHKLERCDWFWVSTDCRKCGAKNDVTARDCRLCGEQMIDPNAKLLGKAYSEDEFVKVEKMEVQPTSNGGILFRYILEGEKPDHGWPFEFFNPAGSETARRVWYNQIIKEHVQDNNWRNKMYAIKSVAGIMKMQAAFDVPTHIAYRINPKGKFVIRKRFRSGRES